MAGGSWDLCFLPLLRASCVGFCRLGAQSRAADWGLTEEAKRRWSLSFRNLFAGNPPSSRETHRHGQDTTIGTLALPEVYPPGLAGAPPRTRRDSRRASARASASRRLSPAASALSRFLRR